MTTKVTIQELAIIAAGNLNPSLLTPEGSLGRCISMG